MRGLGRLLASVALLSCSVVVSSEVELPRCTQSAQCETLNRAHGVVDGAAQRWYCLPGAAATRVCAFGDVDEDGDGESPDVLLGGTDCDDADPRRASRLDEQSDGVDNDCDGVIDEGAWGTSDIVTRDDARPVSTFAPASAAGAVTVALTSDGEGVLARVEGGSVEFSRLAVRTVYTDFSATREVEGRCPYAGAPEGAPCDVRDLAVARFDARRWVSAFVNGVGCASGQLRVAGFADDSTVIVLDARGQGRGSNVALGVDVTPSPACTGASRTPQLLGAALPAVAATVDGGPARALVAWHAQPRHTAACGQAANVEAIGAWVASGLDERGASRSWVNVTGDGVPVVLGASTDGDRPAVVTLGGGAFIAAFGRPDGDISLALAAPFDAPGGNGSVGLSTSTYIVHAGATRTIDAVRLALGATRDGAVDLGLTWKEGCGASGALRFAQARFDPSRARPMEVGAAVTLAADGAGRPALAYVNEGFFVAGARREGSLVGAAGGWVVAWIDANDGRGRLVAARVSEAVPGGTSASTPALVEPPQALATVSAASASVSLEPSQGAAYSLRYLAHDGDARRWITGEFLLRPAPR